MVENLVEQCRPSVLGFSGKESTTRREHLLSHNSADLSGCSCWICFIFCLLCTTNMCRHCYMYRAPWPEVCTLCVFNADRMNTPRSHWCLLLLARHLERACHALPPGSFSAPGASTSCANASACLLRASRLWCISFCASESRQSRAYGGIVRVSDSRGKTGLRPSARATIPPGNTEKMKRNSEEEGGWGCSVDDMHTNCPRRESLRKSDRLHVKRISARK